MQDSIKLSAVIITKNEEANIARCLESIKDLVTEIVIVDSKSTDRTIEICEKYNCNIFQIDWRGFGLAKRYAVDCAKNDWVLSIDADEEITPNLANKISEVLKNTECNIYSIKRDSFYLGKKIKYCGWNKDYPKRLFNKKYGNFNDAVVHETIEYKGKRGTIEESFTHYSYPTIQSHLDKINLYSELGADSLFEQGKKSSVGVAIFYGFIKFIKTYFVKLGILDGVNGLILSINSSYGIFLKYIKLWAKHKGENGKV